MELVSSVAIHSNPSKMPTWKKKTSWVGWLNQAVDRGMG
jgi:hypothetical protein